MNRWHTTLISDTNREVLESNDAGREDQVEGRLKKNTVKNINK